MATISLSQKTRQDTRNTFIYRKGAAVLNNARWTYVRIFKCFELEFIKLVSRHKYN